MRDFIHSFRFKVIIAILTVLIGFMIAAIYSVGTAPIIGVVLKPFQQFSTSVTVGVGEFFDKYFDAAAIYEQNQLLREQNRDLQSKLVDYDRMKHEYGQLIEMEDMREKNKDWVYQTASIINREYADPFFSFTLDKGSLDDIALYDPVITSDGLVGYVIEVGMSTSKVMTLLHINMNIGASNSATRDIGNVTGTVDLARQGLCVMEYLPRESESAVGDLVVTSGGNLFPKGIVIGTVKEVKPSKSATSIEAIIQPATDVRSIKNVLVIIDFEGQSNY